MRAYPSRKHGEIQKEVSPAAVDSIVFLIRRPRNSRPLFPGCSPHDKSRRSSFTFLPRPFHYAHVCAHRTAVPPVLELLDPEQNRLQLMDTPPLDTFLASMQMVSSAVQTLLRYLYFVQHSIADKLGFVYPTEPTELDQVADFAIPFIRYVQTLYDAVPKDTIPDLNTVPELLYILWPVVVAILVTVRPIISYLELRSADSTFATRLR